MRIRLLSIILCILMCLTSCGRFRPQEVVDTSEESSEESMMFTDTESAVDAEQSEESSTESEAPVEKVFNFNDAEPDSVEFHMTDPGLWNFPEVENYDLDFENRYIMTKKDVDVRGIPHNAAMVNYTLFYEMVEVHKVVRATGDEWWSLISFTNGETTYDNVGWVKLSDLMEYTEDNYHLLKYPVTVKEGTKDIETGEDLHPILKNCKVWVAYREDYAKIFAEGDISASVSYDSIIYPPFEKETDID